MRALQKTKEKLSRGIQQLVSFATISKSTSSQDIKATVLDGEVAEKLPYFQDYGFKSRPKGGTAIAINIGGSRDNQAIVAILPEGPDDLADGEVVIYIDDGDEIRVTKDEIKIKSKKIKLDGDVTITGDVTVEGDTTAEGKIDCEKEVTANSNGAKTTLSKHMHPTAVPGPASTPTPGT